VIRKISIERKADVEKISDQAHCDSEPLIYVKKFGMVRQILMTKRDANAYSP